MSANLATRTLTAALASLLTLVMVTGVNALAGHEQERVAANAQAQPMMVAATQAVTVVGHRQS
jgi:hypothetical protein